MMRALCPELRLFLVALQFLSRIPVPAWVGYEDAWMNHCVRHFPLVGGIVGCAGALVLTLALALFPPTVAVLLSMITTVWLTGAFHEDGLADTCDGLGGAVSRERALEIMKDSRIGTYGAVGLMLVLALKAATLLELALIHPVLACIALIWGHAASRTVAVGLMRMLPYAGDAEHAKAKPLATSVRGVDVAVAIVTMLLLSAAAGLAWPLQEAAAGGELASGHSGAAELVPPDGVDFAFWTLLAAWLSLGATALLAKRWLRRRLDGYTGDTLGATQQVAEIVSLLTWLGCIQVIAAWHG